MPNVGIEGGQDWLAVIARALAFLCLHNTDMHKRDVGEQSALLQSLGLSNEEIAPLVGSTPNSVRVLLQNKRTNPRWRKNASKTSKKKRR